MQNAVFVVIIAILALPLIFNRREALVVIPALGALFVLGFIGPFLDMYGHIALAVLGMALAAAVPIAIGRRVRSGGAALVSGIAFVMLAGLVVGYGIYVARETGWHHLTRLGHSSEWPHGNIGLIWLPFIFLSPALLFIGFIYGAVCSWAHSRLTSDAKV